MQPWASDLDALCFVLLTCEVRVLRAPSLTGPLRGLHGLIHAMRVQGYLSSLLIHAPSERPGHINQGEIRGLIRLHVQPSSPPGPTSSRGKAYLHPVPSQGLLWPWLVLWPWGAAVHTASWNAAAGPLSGKPQGIHQPLCPSVPTAAVCVCGDSGGTFQHTPGVPAASHHPDMLGTEGPPHSMAPTVSDPGCSPARPPGDADTNGLMPWLLGRVTASVFISCDSKRPQH